MEKEKTPYPTEYSRSKNKGSSLAQLFTMPGSCQAALTLRLYHICVCIYVITYVSRETSATALKQRKVYPCVSSFPQLGHGSLQYSCTPFGAITPVFTRTYSSPPHSRHGCWGLHIGQPAWPHICLPSLYCAAVLWHITSAGRGCWGVSFKFVLLSFRNHHKHSRPHELSILYAHIPFPLWCWRWGFQHHAWSLYA